MERDRHIVARLSVDAEGQRGCAWVIRSEAKAPHAFDVAEAIPQLAEQVPGKTTPELPVKPPGYYQEFVHPTPGVSGAGSQRIVRGAGGELYYTPNHYDTFVPLN